MRNLLQIFLLLFSLVAVFHSSGQTIDEIEKILPIPGPRQTELGQAIAIDGDFAVVGDWGDDTHSENGGIAYVLEYSGGSWNEVARLSPSDSPGSGRFGFSVAISGNTIVVGTPIAENTTFGGAVYVFEKPAGGWSDMTETSKLNSGNSVPGASFGYSVGLSGTILVVGARDDNTVTLGGGRSYVFEKTTGWSKVATLQASDVGTNDLFGHSVAISGGTIAIGANQADNKGAVYVFEDDGVGWTEKAKLTASDATLSEKLGSSLVIEGSTIVASHPNDAVTGSSNGSVYIFEKPGSGWVSATETQKITASDLDRWDYFGESVSISGNSLIAGAWGLDDNGANSGGIYVFEYNTNNSLWEEEAIYTAFDGIAFDQMGRASAISNDRLLVNGGVKVYAHEKPAGGWTSGTINPIPLAALASNSFDLFGSSIAIEGNIAVVGAPDTDKVQINGQGVGAVYVLEFDGNNWNHKAVLSPSETRNANFGLNGNFGTTVAISGTTIVVGDPQNDSPDQDRGAVYVFEMPVGGWQDMTETDRLIYSGGSANEKFGISIDIEGSTLAVGTPNDDQSKGSVVIFNYDGSDWIENQTLETSDRENGDRFGQSLKLHGNTLVVSAVSDNSGEGSAYVFEYDENTGWTEIAKLTASDGTIDHSLGNQIAMDANNIVLTTLSGGDLNLNGAAYIYEKPAGSWISTTESQKIFAADGTDGIQNFFGFSVELLGDLLLIGASFDTPLKKGAVYVFEEDGGWNQTDKLIPASIDDEERFGSSIAIFGEQILIGARAYSGQFKQSGAIFQYQIVQPPSVTVSGTGGAVNTNPTEVTVTFSQAVLGFDPVNEAGDLTLVNATLTSATTNDNITYILEIVPIAEGPLQVSVPASAATGQEAGGDNEVSNTYSVIYDITPPTAEALAAYTLNLDASGNATLTGTDIDNGSNDANGIAQMTVTPESFDCTDIGDNPYTVVLSVIDNAGNSSATTTELTVAFGAYVDNTPPTVIGQGIVIVLNEEGEAQILASQVDNGSSDDCGIDQLELDKTIFTCDDEGDNTVTLTVTDLFGNENSTQVNVEVKAGVFWYEDLDGDGFGDPNSFIETCNRPMGYVADNTDCDDEDGDEFSGQTWYLDFDQDGFGDPNSSIVNCERPNGMVLDNSDCDDLDVNVNPNLVWYEDNDGDGFGNPESSQTACIQPAGYVLDNTDCNDSDNNINPETTWYADNDSDGFGDADVTQTACEQPVGYVLDNTDCDDSDISVNPNLIWYRDADNDGFGDLATTLMSCTQPLGYILDNTDCNDSNSEEQPGQTWYRDSDSDGFGNPAVSMISCLQPAGYVLNNTDCEDSDAASQSSVWYQDSDGDGYGNPDVIENTCTQPAGYVANDEDCNDTDPTINPDLMWYGDSDVDGFGNPNIVLNQCTQPAGYVPNSTDCDDGDTNVNPESTDVAGSGIDANCDGTYLWFTDSDGDGFGTSEVVESANATPGVGESDSNTDCNDTDANINPSATDVAGSGIDANCDGIYLWYVDNDGDGFGRLTTTSSQNSTLGVGEADNSNDCDDNDSDEFPEQVWYADLDGDGFGDPDSEQAACERPLNYVLNSDDCNDNDEEIVEATTWYADTDGDGYGDLSNAQQSCEQPIGFIADNTDCDDSDATINTDGADVAGSGIDANCDGLYLWFVDADGDGFGTSETTSSANSTPGTDESVVNTDCDDTDADEYPGQIWFADIDGDGYGDLSNTQQACEQPDGYVLDRSDCNDNDSAINIDGTDIPGSGIDANCDGQYLWFVDADGDGFGTSETISSANSTPGTGESAVDTDCDDTDASINPNTNETGKNCVVLSSTEKKSIKVFPNPTSSIIHLPGHIRAGANVFIYDLNGKVIHKAILPDNGVINLRTIPNGIYFVKTNDVDGSPVEWKVIKTEK